MNITPKTCRRKMIFFYYTVRTTVPKSKGPIVERGKIATPKTETRSISRSLVDTEQSSRKLMRNRYHRYLWTGPYMMPLMAHPPFFFGVIHRKLQNVVYMKKKSMLKKRGERSHQRHHIGSCPQVPVKDIRGYK